MQQQTDWPRASLLDMPADVADENLSGLPGFASKFCCCMSVNVHYCSNPGNFAAPPGGSGR